MSRCVNKTASADIRESQAVSLSGGQGNPASGSPESGRFEVAVSSRVLDVVEAASEGYD